MAMSRSPGLLAVTSTASMRTMPAVGSSRPAMICSTVDLPQPDGPTSETNSPSLTSKLTSRRADPASLAPEPPSARRRLPAVVLGDALQRDGGHVGLLLHRAGGEAGHDAA